ncbi:metallophosphoesterase family protein [Azospirillum sp. Sh1]|uniref:metallophosphoesterase family protein n=1 Tax=Azospirillum sp. Sh1 TaxID=2607285 RepID=UPI0011EE8088|nr:metallophosphoesterase family protein [Azospirillum sp. Sh1]KAA0569944.1 metallophosphoesterase family protein [Azospirillum sp. Sh1]
MKLVIISDIHGNHEALRALPEEYDELWVLGDLVNYGPQPREVVADIMDKASLVVQGNHDHAVAYDDDSRWSPRYRPIAEATRRYTSSVLSEAQKVYLRGLPQQAQAKRDGLLFHLTHAMPSDPLYGRYPTDTEGWDSVLDGLQADVLLVGHTHVPILRKVRDRIVLNPGSLGQPRTGTSLASYAVCQNGHFELKSFRYPVEATVAKLRELALPRPVESELVAILETGSA